MGDGYITMLMSVSELSDLIGLSKVSIYNKLKLKELEPYVLKSKGVTYITDDGVNLIKQLFNLNEDTLNPLNEEDNRIGEETNETIENKEIEEIKGQLKELSIDYINSLKEENETLKNQLREKDKQIEELHKLVENNQVLLKYQHDKEIKQLQQSEHFQEIDEKLMELKEKLIHKEETKKSFFGFLKK